MLLGILSVCANGTAFLAEHMKLLICTYVFLAIIRATAVVGIAHFNIFHYLSLKGEKSRFFFCHRIFAHPHIWSQWVARWYSTVARLTYSDQTNRGFVFSIMRRVFFFMSLYNKRFYAAMEHCIRCTKCSFT